MKRIQDWRGYGIWGKNISLIPSPASCILIFLIPLFLYSNPVFSSEKKSPVLPKEYVQKLKRIATNIASEIISRNIKSVMVNDFTDLKGRQNETGKEMAKEFKKHLTSAGAANFSVIDSNAEAVVYGTIAPFKEKGKLRLQIKVISSSTGKTITTYTGVFKKPREGKK
jgi:hypothetical protein